MAGAGYKQFADGDVLTAAQVQTFLQDQAVMRFADSSARDAALGTAVAEGMVAYLNDTDEVLFYDGSAWGAVGLALGTATPTEGQILAFGTATSTWNPTDQLAGIGSNVVQTVKTDTFTTTSTSYADVTGLSVSITPTSAASRVLVVAHVSGTQQVGTNTCAVQLVRDSTALSIGDADGLRTRASAMLATRDVIDITNATIVYLDSPATTSATTYKMQIKTNAAGTVYVNRSTNDTNNDDYVRTVSSITVIEVAA